MENKADFIILQCSEQDKTDIFENLKLYNAGYFVSSTVCDLSFCMKDGAGKVIAGIVATLKGNVVDISYLWVAQAARKKGCGSLLLKTLEKKAKEKNANRINVDTYEFQAPDFYPKYGFKLYAYMENCVGKYGKFYYTKEITPQ